MTPARTPPSDSPASTSPTRCVARSPFPLVRMVSVVTADSCSLAGPAFLSSTCASASRARAAPASSTWSACTSTGTGPRPSCAPSPRSAGCCSSSRACSSTARCVVLRLRPLRAQAIAACFTSRTLTPLRRLVPRQIWAHGKAAGQTFEKAKGEVAAQGFWCVTPLLRPIAARAGPFDRPRLTRTPPVRRPGSTSPTCARYRECEPRSRLCARAPKTRRAAMV